MSRVVYRHENVTRCFIGKVHNFESEPELFLQVESSQGSNTVKIEAEQLQALVERFTMMIRELRRSKLSSLEDLNALPIHDEGKLDFPIEEDFAVGVIAISFQEGIRTIELQIQALGEVPYEEVIEDEGEGDEELPDLLIIPMSIPLIRGFCERSKRILASGNQPCPFCGISLTSQGHICPRANGYRR